MQTAEQKPLDWFYGPTATDPDPAKQWHRNCGGEVWFIDGGFICSKCKEQEEANEMMLGMGGFSIDPVDEKY